MTLSSQVIISSNIVNTILELEKLRTDESIVEIISPSLAESLNGDSEDVQSEYRIQRIVTQKDTFRVEDAKIVIEKAYMASEEKSIIILAATNFLPLIQNKLLKVIEEPPKNKEFILITESKSTILSTIKSRLPITVLSEKKEEETLGLDVLHLSLNTVYDFTQLYKRTDAQTMKYLVERIAQEAMESQSYNLDEKTLSLFSNTFKALDMGSPPQFVLNTLLLKLLAKKKK